MLLALAAAAAGEDEEDLARARGETAGEEEGEEKGDEAVGDEMPDLTRPTRDSLRPARATVFRLAANRSAPTTSEVVQKAPRSCAAAAETPKSGVEKTAVAD